MFKCCFGQKTDKLKVYKQAKQVEKCIGNISKANKSIQLITLLDDWGQVISYVTPSELDKDKIESIMQKIMLFKQSCDSMATSIGFDYSSDVYLKGK